MNNGIYMCEYKGKLIDLIHLVDDDGWYFQDGVSTTKVFDNRADAMEALAYRRLSFEDDLEAVK